MKAEAVMEFVEEKGYGTAVEPDFGAIVEVEMRKRDWGRFYYPGTEKEVVWTHFEGSEEGRTGVTR